MARFHQATITPTKAELIAEWSPTRPWGPSPGDSSEVIGSCRFDDPEGRVGMEVHLATGPTDLANLYPVCTYHHHLIHDTEWPIEILPDHTLLLRDHHARPRIRHRQPRRPTDHARRQPRPAGGEPPPTPRRC